MSAADDILRQFSARVAGPRRSISRAEFIEDLMAKVPEIPNQRCVPLPVIGDDRRRLDGTYLSGGRRVEVVIRLTCGMLVGYGPRPDGEWGALQCRRVQGHRGSCTHHPNIPPAPLRLPAVCRGALGDFGSC